MNRHDFLSSLHAAYAPRNYLEIGVNDGRGLQRSHTRSIGVDPAFKVTAEVECDLQLVKATSDEFFARDNPIARFPEGHIDLTFIDGMHLFEFALRDFINAERLASPTSVIVFDDMLPRTQDEAARDRHTLEWTGDVFKVAAVLERYRPDLVTLQLDTTPTGLLLVLGADPQSKVLRDNHDAILAEYVEDDPQTVPTDVLHRTCAADPKLVLADPVWSELIAARDSGSPAPASLQTLRELRGTAQYLPRPMQHKPWPPHAHRPGEAELRHARDVAARSAGQAGATVRSALKTARRRFLDRRG